MLWRFSSVWSIEKPKPSGLALIGACLSLALEEGRSGHMLLKAAKSMSYTARPTYIQLRAIYCQNSMFRTSPLKFQLPSGVGTLANPSRLSGLTQADRAGRGRRHFFPVLPLPSHFLLHSVGAPGFLPVFSLQRFILAVTFRSSLLFFLLIANKFEFLWTWLVFFSGL
jgi:hypothetical protein